MLTKRQIEKVQKVTRLNKGADIKVSKENVRRIAKKGGSLNTSTMAASTKLLPKVLPIPSSAVSKYCPHKQPVL